MTDAAPTLAVLMGLPGAGKTTFYERCLAPTYAHVSMDALSGRCDKRRRERELIVRALAARRSVAVDDVNATIAARAELVALAEAASAAVVGYWLDAPSRACLGRNRRREGKARVPPVAIFTFAKRFQPPTLAEGFAALWRVRAAGTAEDPTFGLAPLS
jgi:predicted kinase